MGYHVDMMDASFNMKKENLLPALKAVKDFIRVSAQLRWVDNYTILNASNLAEVMEEFKYELSVDDLGNVYDIGYDSDKQGDEETIFRVIAPYVEPDSYIEMLGEDGDRWRYLFKDGVLKILQGRVVWDEESEGL